MGKKVLLFIFTFMTVVVLGAASYAFQFFTSTSSTITEEIERNPEFEKHYNNINLENGDPISILIMGIDKAVNEKRGRSDTLVLATIDPKAKSMHLVSIPRDTYTEVEGAVNKINSTYHLGGTQMTVSAVENLLDVPADYYVKVNMEGFTQIVDTLGGVGVNNDLDFTYKKVHFPKKQIKLNGKEALLYARMRKADPRGDFGRQKRQRQVIEAVIEKGSKMSSFTKFSETLQIVEKNVRTNMTFNDMWKIQSNYKNAQKNIEQHNIQGTGKTINGRYYHIPDKQKLRSISKELKRHLKID